MIRVLIADDHPVFRFGLRTLLKADPAMEVVGEAMNGEGAIAQAASLHPDVIREVLALIAHIWERPIKPTFQDDLCSCLIVHD